MRSEREDPSRFPATELGMRLGDWIWNNRERFSYRGDCGLAGCIYWGRDWDAAAHGERTVRRRCSVGSTGDVGSRIGGCSWCSLALLEERLRGSVLGNRETREGLQTDYLVLIILLYVRIFSLFWTPSNLAVYVFCYIGHLSL